MKSIKKAIIPAAGYGTRSLPITKVLPKEMFPIACKPAIEYIVEEAIDSGIEELLIVVSRHKNLILDYFDRSLDYEAFLEKKGKHNLLEKIMNPRINIQYVRQPFADGLGAAILLGKKFVGNDPFAVLLPDDLFVKKEQSALQELINVYENYHSSVIALEKVKEELLKNYGVVKGSKLKDRSYEINDIVEKPRFNAPSNLAVSGRYIFTPSIFSYLEKINKGVGGELQLTDAIKELLILENCYGVQVTSKRYDIGTEEGYFKILQHFMSNRKEQEDR
ncbi:UTP--glucose-1-phosphate uridylyltransferase [Bacillus pinisoli]|uniref:UTP--glucose-1-phosphate uridylyltransferase n=1 Tax=Bacillus pinisoli TaxID=2901866 RepID=UPI001FF562EF|nr:UTP--glucose-1-phosphate uridylyltransferase [Bacillus pinisoli]